MTCGGDGGNTGSGTCGGAASSLLTGLGGVGV